MNFIDIILAGILLYGLIKGLWKGLFVELASLVSLLLGVYLSIKFLNATPRFSTVFRVDREGIWKSLINE